MDGAGDVGLEAEDLGGQVVDVAGFLDHLLLAKHALRRLKRDPVPLRAAGLEPAIQNGARCSGGK